MASAFHPVPRRSRCVDFIGICALRVRRMLRIALGLIFWTLAMGIPSLRAQDAQGHPIGSPSQTPPDAWSDDGRTTIVPRTNTPAAKDIGEGPSPADAWWKLGRMYADRGDHARAFPIFSDLVDSYRTGSRRVPAGIAANSHVALGVYYVKGIPGTLPADPDFGYGLLEYAASYFGDPNAQYARPRAAGRPTQEYHSSRALVAGSGKEKPPAGTGPARRYLVQRRRNLAPSRAGAVLAHARERWRRSARSLDQRPVRQCPCAGDRG